MKVSDYNRIVFIWHGTALHRRLVKSDPRMCKLIVQPNAIWIN